MHRSHAPLAHSARTLRAHTPPNLPHIASTHTLLPHTPSPHSRPPPHLPHRITACKNVEFMANCNDVENSSLGADGTKQGPKPGMSGSMGMPGIPGDEKSASGQAQLI